MEKKPFLTESMAQDIIQDVPTPFHVYDEKGIRENARRINKAFSWNKGFKEYFAVKALPNPVILQILKEEGCGVDCSSLTELMLSEACGFTGHEIMFSSNQTPVEDMKKAYELGGRCLASALHTAENMLVPACLAVYLQFSGGRAEAVAQYGNLKGMALPLLTFPFGLLGSLSVLLMPEITQAHLRGQNGRLVALIDRMLRLTGYFSALAGAAFWVWGQPLAEALYGSAEAGSYLVILGPAMPLMYLESMVDGAMKGVGEQKAAFRYSVWDAVLRLAGVAVLLPRYGMRGFLTVILLSSFYTCAANTGRLLLSSGTGHAFRRWLGAPLLAAAAAGAAGRGVRRALTGFPAQGLPGQLAVLTAGGTVTAIVFLLAALPLGLWEELRAVLRQAKTGKNRGK